MSARRGEERSGAERRGADSSPIGDEDGVRGEWLTTVIARAEEREKESEGGRERTC